MFKHIVLISMLGATSVAAQNQQCEIRQVPVYATHNEWGGALVGGIIGNQVGNGQGKVAATILGMMLGRNVAQQTQTTRIIGYRQIQVCTYNIDSNHNAPHQYQNNTNGYPMQQNNMQTLTQCNVGGRLVRC